MALAGALAFSGLALACSSDPPRPSIVVVLIDQLRKDSADRYLNRVNALAEDGVAFEEMRATAPWGRRAPFTRSARWTAGSRWAMGSPWAPTGAP